MTFFLALIFVERSEKLSAKTAFGVNVGQVKKGGKFKTVFFESTWRRNYGLCAHKPGKNEQFVFKRPQASLLGPLLFNIYMNDLNHFVQGSSLRLYADDTTAYASDTSPLVLEYIINSDLQSVCKCFENNYLNINTTKTQAMAIGPVNYEYNINLHNSNIDLNDSFKILGVTLDRKMTFKPYILEQLKKACAKTAALGKLRKFIPQEVMIRLYKAYILPHLEYCSPLLLGISN